MLKAKGRPLTGVRIETIPAGLVNDTLGVAPSRGCGSKPEGKPMPAIL